MNKKVMIVAAHPDDEILGCGGTARRFINNGYGVHTLILGEGITSRDKARDAQKRGKALAELKKEARAANKALGVSKVIMRDFPDNRFDSVPFLDIVKVVEEVKDDLMPEIIFTHYGDDLNIDHRIAFQAVVTATRPVRGEPVREVYSFEVLSSTDWNFPLHFSPDVFFDITNSINYKLKAAAEYRAELRKFPHPRSLEGIRLNARYWGMRVGAEYAEAFKAVRIIR